MKRSVFTRRGWITPRARRVLLVVWRISLAGCIGCSLVLITLAVLQRARSHVPFNQVVFERDGAYYYRPTGGKVETRPTYPISREQFMLYTSYKSWQMPWAGGAASLFLVCVVLTLILFKGEQRGPVRIDN